MLFYPKMADNLKVCRNNLQDIIRVLNTVDTAETQLVNSKVFIIDSSRICHPI